MVDLEIALVKAYQWPIHVIEQTDVESLMLFVHRLGAKQTGSRSKRTTIDKAGWL